jgi:hypothetical protein
MNELYEKHLKIRDKDRDIKIGHINELLLTYPELIDSVLTKIDTSFGEHTVYIIHVNKHGRDMIKIGYTKNTVEQRYGEKRWGDQIVLEDIKEKLRDKRLPALGAMQLENKIKEYIKPYNLKGQITGPGKGELYDISCKDLIIETYDKYFDSYKDIVGTKKAN